jgi:hypothetical protein
VFSYLKISFIASEAEGKKLKKGSLEAIGFFFYYLQYEKLYFIKEFLIDTVYVTMDGLIISGLVISFLSKNWVYAIGLLILRLLIFINFDKNNLNIKNRHFKIIDKDIRRYKDLRKKFEEKK